MKRRREQEIVVTHNKKDDDDQIQQFGPSIMDIPTPVFTDILLRLPLKGIIFCKCVCKTWRCLISDPQFAKLHFKQAKPCPLFRTSDTTRVSRLLYLVEPQYCHNFDFRGCLSAPFGNENDRYFEMKLETKLQIPLRNPEMLLYNEGDDAKMSVMSRGVGAKRKHCVKVKPKDHQFKIVNSCNGFLCLSEPLCHEPAVVCNPITGEYINLPVPKKTNENAKSYVDCGFGFSPKTNQYKVIRMFSNYICDPSQREPMYNGRETEIHTLGTGSWNSIGAAPSSEYKLAFPTYLNAALHWLHIDRMELGYIDRMELDYIVSFSLEMEQFQSFSSPKLLEYHGGGIPKVSMGVLRGWLCICDASCYTPINIWVMKDYGVRKSWTNLISIDTTGLESWPYGLSLPINYLNGAILLFHYSASAIIRYNPKKDEMKYFKLRGVKSSFEAIVHTPSFVSLKDALIGADGAMQTIKSRLADLKFLGETRAISLEEDIAELAPDIDPEEEDVKLHRLWWRKY